MASKTRLSSFFWPGVYGCQAFYAIKCIVGWLSYSVMGVKMCRIWIKMGLPLAQHGASLAPFHANGAHPSAPCSSAHNTPLAAI